MEELLKISDLSVEFKTERATVHALNGLNLTIYKGESLGLVNEIGIENIEAHVRELATYCMDRIEEIGGTLITHRDPGHFGGIVIARLYDDLDTDRMILKKLHARKIFIAQRFTDYVGGFRISCQYFNNKKDIDTMIEGMKDLIKEIGREPDYKG